MLANVLGAVVAAGGIASNVRWSWLLGIFIVGVFFVLYLAQETVGSPAAPELVGAEPDPVAGCRSAVCRPGSPPGRHMGASIRAWDSVASSFAVASAAQEQVPGSVLQQHLAALQPVATRPARRPVLSSGRAGRRRPRDP